MEYTVVLPDVIAQQLERYAREHQQAPAQAITDLLARDLAPAEQPLITPRTYPLGVNPLERYIGIATDRYPHLTDDEVLAGEAGGELRHEDAE